MQGIVAPMLLYRDGLQKVRRALMLVAAGKPSPFVKIGTFSPSDLEAINRRREEQGYPPIRETIVFNGKHIYKSRCQKNGYTIEEVVEHIEIAFSRATQLEDGRRWGTVLISPSLREDKNGKNVRDEVVFECSAKFPDAILFSVIPRGDGRFVP